MHLDDENQFECVFFKRLPVFLRQTILEIQHGAAWRLVFFFFFSFHVDSFSTAMNNIEDPGLHLGRSLAARLAIAVGISPFGGQTREGKSEEISTLFWRKKPEEMPKTIGSISPTY